MTCCYICSHYQSCATKQREVWLGRCNKTGRFVHWDAAKNCKKMDIDVSAYDYATPVHNERDI